MTPRKGDKGIKLYDPGYQNTAPMRSSICYMDGDEGILRYRGYPIEELADNSTFLEDILDGMPHDAHPMGLLVNAMSALSVFHPDANPAIKGKVQVDGSPEDFREAVKKMVSMLG